MAKPHAFISPFLVFTGLIALPLMLLLGCDKKEKQAAKTERTEKQTPNILFIAVDDLRPQLGCYGQDFVKSPNFDRLAASSTLFERAYCNVPVCGASRASLLSGLRPAPTRFVDYKTYLNQDAPEAVSLAEHFKKNGYYTVSLGKIAHHQDDIPEAWSEPAWQPETNGTNWRDYLSRTNLVLSNQIPDSLLTKEDKALKKKYEGTPERGLPYEQVDTTDEAYFDGKLAQKGIEKLRELKQKKQPFFLGLGFVKPHLPFIAPKKYWDLYDPNSLPFPGNYYRSDSIPSYAYSPGYELRNYGGIPHQDDQLVLDTAMAKKLIHGYHASVSYTDALLGKVLDALEQEGLSDSTVVLLWGDHGWYLGEHTMWCKHATFREALKTVLMVRQPGQNQGRRVAESVELLDIYPTLCEMAGLEQPSHLQGRSLQPLLADNSQTNQQKAVYSRFRSRESVKLGKYLYTEFRNKKGEVLGNMLFDHEKDPNENDNVAGEPGYQKITQRLSDSLARHRQQYYKGLDYPQAQ